VASLTSNIQTKLKASMMKSWLYFGQDRQQDTKLCREVSEGGSSDAARSQDMPSARCFQTSSYLEFSYVPLKVCNIPTEVFLKG